MVSTITPRTVAAENTPNQAFCDRFCEELTPGSRAFVDETLREILSEFHKRCHRQMLQTIAELRADHLLESDSPEHDCLLLGPPGWQAKPSECYHPRYRSDGRCASCLRFRYEGWSGQATDYPDGARDPRISTHADRALHKLADDDWTDLGRNNTRDGWAEPGRTLRLCNDAANEKADQIATERRNK